MDPLSLLREFNIAKQLDKITEEGDKVNFADRYTFPKTAPTTYRSQNGKGDLYTVEAVLLFVRYRTQPIHEYIKSARQLHIPQVHVTDRKTLAEYLDGTVEAASLQFLEAPELLAEAVAPVKSSHAQEPEAKRQKLQGADDNVHSAVKALRAQERQLRDRNSMLLSPNRDFRKVLEILNAVKHKKLLQQQQPRSQSHHQASRENREHHHRTSNQKSSHPNRPPPPPSKPAPTSAAAQAAMFVKPSGRFERDTTGDQLKAMGGEEAAGLGQIISLYGYKGQKPDDKPAPAPKASTAETHNKSAAPSSASNGDLKSKKTDRTPIIIVPAGLSALINMYNAAQFLEKGMFIPSDKVMKDGGSKQSRMLINRQAQRPKGVPYHITDKAPPKGSPEWERVVAVIVQGAKWQFKDWTYFKGAAEGDLVETFTKVCGFFLHYSDEKVPPLVSSWNVKKLAIPRANRHKDMTLLLDLYKTLDHFLATRRCNLMY